MVTREILNHFREKTVLITGHTGFKGSWLTYLLTTNDVKVVGYSLSPATQPNLFSDLELDKLCDSNIGDVNDFEHLSKIVSRSQPDFIFHMAAQPLVRYSYQNPIETFQTNVMGTANVLESCKFLKKKCCVVCITTDKVYANNEWYFPYREIDTLGGYDPYSASKAASEFIIDSYRKSFFTDSHVFLASARAGNVIGGGDWSTDRLIPDIIKAHELGKNAVIRNPNSIRPWQHVLDPLFGYLSLAKALDEYGTPFCEAYNFGPRPDEATKVSEVCNILKQELTDLKITTDNPSSNNPHEAGILTLDTSKALNRLGWKPVWNTKTAILKTAKWYKNHFESKSLISAMNNDINSFFNHESV
jgi:CDP-glucose 4,6-dehydratase